MFPLLPIPPPESDPSSTDPLDHEGADPKDDHTLTEAQAELRKDLDRIEQLHIITWDYDPFGGVRYWCSCPRKGPRTASKLDLHIIHAIEVERGPQRPPNNKPK